MGKDDKKVKEVEEAIEKVVEEAKEEGIKVEVKKESLIKNASSNAYE